MAWASETRGEKVRERRSELMSIRDRYATMHHGRLHHMRLQGEGSDSVQIILTTSEKTARILTGPTRLVF
jgi:hypothetical protein